MLALYILTLTLQRHAPAVNSKTSVTMSQQVASSYSRSAAVQYNSQSQVSDVTYFKTEMQCITQTLSADQRRWAALMKAACTLHRGPHHQLLCSKMQLYSRHTAALHTRGFMPQYSGLTEAQTLTSGCQTAML